MQATEDGEVSARYNLVIHAVTETSFPGAPLAATAASTTGSSSSSSSKSGAATASPYQTAGRNSGTRGPVGGKASRRDYEVHQLEVGLHLNLSQLLGPAALKQEDILTAEKGVMGSACKGLLLIGDLGLEEEEQEEAPWRVPPLGLVTVRHTPLLGEAVRKP